MADGSKPCPYRLNHEWDEDGICRNCYAKRPDNPHNWINAARNGSSNWVAQVAQDVADEPLGSDITPVRMSSLIEILNWDELTKLRTLGVIDIVGTPDRIIIERTDGKCSSIHSSSIDDGPP